MFARLRHAPEVRIFLILIPLINVFNYYLTYNHISFNLHTFVTFTLDVLEGYAAWLAVHFIILYLDRKFPFTENVISRLILQLCVTLFTGMFIIIGLTTIIHYATYDEPIPVSFFTYDIFIISVWFLVVNGIYVAMYFYNQWRNAEIKRVEENKIKTGRLHVKSGKQEFLLDFSEIAGFLVDGEYVICHTMSSKKYLLDQSMDKLEKGLPAVYFFRINRQLLLHRQAVSGFQKGDNGKLNVLLNPITSFSPIAVSRTKAPAFKIWFQPE
jgi:hypothetical protein